MARPPPPCPTMRSSFRRRPTRPCSAARSTVTPQWQMFAMSTAARPSAVCRRRGSTSRSTLPPASDRSTSARSSSSTWDKGKAPKTGAGAAVSTIAHQIQLAVAPVFLLAGIGSILNVMAGPARPRGRAGAAARARLRLVRRGGRAAWRRRSSRILDLRMTVVNFALSACTAAALFVCVLVAICAASAIRR